MGACGPRVPLKSGSCDPSNPLWHRPIFHSFPGGGEEEEEEEEEEEGEEIVSPLQAEDLMSVFHLFESPDPPGQDPVMPRPSHAVQEHAGSSVEAPLVTRRGRRIRRPKYLAGYVTD